MAVNEMHATPQSIDAVQDNPRDDFREGVVGVWTLNDEAT